MLNRSSTKATIAAAASLSGAVDLLGFHVDAILFPAAWTAADLTFQTSHDGVTYGNVFDDAATPLEVVVGADAALWVQVRAAVGTKFGRFIKVRSGTAGTPVVQAAERILIIAGSSPL